MRYRKLTSDGDYSFGSGELDFWIDVPEAVAQSVETRLLLWLGEWFLNIESGTAWVQGVLGKKTKMEMDATIQDRVLSGVGVTDIQNYESEINAETRGANLRFNLDTIYGPTKVDLENYRNY